MKAKKTKFGWEFNGKLFTTDRSSWSQKRMVEDDVIHPKTAELGMVIAGPIAKPWLGMQNGAKEVFEAAFEKALGFKPELDHEYDKVTSAFNAAESELKAWRAKL
jgi:hypothetical protein